MKATAASALGSQPVRRREHDTQLHWIRGGTNEPHNLTLLCYRHHWMVHEGNWQILRGDDGRLVTIPPMVTFGPSARGPD